ncbi:LytTR family DNA-binding domain-containing protein [Paraflavisolibacter sp. H34]|uniref:LytR/AlgR family response regulator transcription factor n=1 Tax=Huijunlia imazamoxiresistens TaxID=3127457 RepID=UPI00301A1848
MNVMVFEDEKLNAERLVQLLHQCRPGIEVTAVVASVAEGIALFSHRHPPADLIFMDIQLSDGNCFELFDRVAIRIPIIFTTAYDNFALQAFKVYSVDYLLKPIDIKDLKRALEKFEQFRMPVQPAIDVARIAEEFFRREHTRFLGKMNNQLIYVKARDITSVYFEEGITWANSRTHQKIPLDYSLEKVERMLDKHLFFRINRKLIIHIDAIRKITTYYNNRFIVELHEPIPGLDAIVSRDRVNSFKSWLEGRESGG